MAGGGGAEDYIQNMERKEVIAKIAWVGRQKNIKGKMNGWAGQKSLWKRCSLSPGARVGLKPQKAR